MIDKIVYITLLQYVRQKKFFRFPERAAGVIVFLPKVLAALSVLHLFVGEDGFVQFQNTTEQVIASIPLVVLILNTLYIWRFSDHEEKTTREVEQTTNSPQDFKSMYNVLFPGSSHSSACYQLSCVSSIYQSPWIGL